MDFNISPRDDETMAVAAFAPDQSEQSNKPTHEPGGSRPPGQRLTDILTQIANDEGRERISIGDLLGAMGDRTFGALMFIFAMPNVFPTPPGTSTLLGTPLLFLAAQLAFGRKPWLPKLIANRSMSRSDFAGLISKALPWLAKGEKLLRPRGRFFVAPPAEYLIGTVCLLLAIILVLPIPLGNILPALAICLFSLGLLEKDGLWIMIGAIGSIISLFVVSGVVYAFLKAAIFVFANALG